MSFGSARAFDGFLEDIAADRKDVSLNTRSALVRNCAAVAIRGERIRPASSSREILG
jgi:hypothetical protein